MEGESTESQYASKNFQQDVQLAQNLVAFNSMQRNIDDDTAMEIMQKDDQTTTQTPTVVEPQPAAE